MADLPSPTPGSTEFVRLQVENALLKKGVKGTMLDDAADVLMSRVSKTEGGQVSISGLPIDTAIDTHVAARPHLLTGAPPSEALRSAARAGWDPTRVAEPAYGAEWKKADPKGYQEAFDSHMRAVMKKNRETANGI